MLYVGLRPGQTCYSQDGGSYILHGVGGRGRAWLTILDRVKIPRYSHKVMQRKRVTCELHDRYFRSMTIKHAIPKMAGVHIPMASYGEVLSGRELLYNSVHREFKEFWGSDELELRCGRENQHPERLGPMPPIEQPRRTGKKS